MPKQSVVCLFTILLAAAPLNAAAPASEPSTFQISSPTRIPGETLTPGPYSIHVVNRLSDRMILRVDAAGSGVHATFLGIPNSRIDKPSAPGPVKWSNTSGGPGYLRGWYFQGTPSVVEFVYPKADAVAIATSNPAKVPAVDPASEGKVTDNTLSQDDMQLLTLWLLSLQEIGPAGHAAGIKAERYQQVAFNKQKPVIANLPHTASNLPLVWILGLFSVIAGAAFRTFSLQKTLRAKPFRTE